MGGTWPRRVTVVRAEPGPPAAVGSSQHAGLSPPQDHISAHAVRRTPADGETHTAVLTAGGNGITYADSPAGTLVVGTPADL